MGVGDTTGAAVAAGIAEAAYRACGVASPATPSTVRPFFRWNSYTAANSSLSTSPFWERKSFMMRIFS